MLTAFILGISTFTSILWSIVFLFPQYFDFVLYHISGNMLNAFIPTIKTYSYSSNEEPCGWVVGWSDGFYIGFLSNISGGNGPHGPIKNLYIFTSKKFYNTHISKNNDNDIHEGHEGHEGHDSCNKKSKNKNITLFIREGQFYHLDYRPNTYKAPSKLFPPKVSQTLIINEILEIYDTYTHPYARVLLCAKPGFGKSTIAIHLCYELLNIYEKVSLVTTWTPTDPNDSFIRLYNKVKPSIKAPLVILLDEIDITITNIIEGKIKISDASPMPIEIINKKGWNDFFDAFDIEIYKYVIVIMTSNKYTSFFNNLEPSLLREGRIDIVKDCDCGES
jgi:hypothetical protein